MEEQTLLDKCVKGDVRAFEELIKKYQQAVLNHTYSMLLNREDALDMAQETFLKAYHGIAGFHRQSSFKTWLLKIATNVCLDELRRRKRRMPVLPLTEETAQIDVADASVDPEKTAQQRLAHEAIVHAIGTLDMMHRAVIVLREIEGMDYNEIAKTLGCTVGTVKSRLSRARAQLRKKLSEDGELF